MKKNVASQVIGAQMVSASDGSAFTGSVTVAVTGNAGTQATGSVGSGACTHEGNGFHTYAPAQAETNYDHVAFTFTGTGAIPATVQVYTTFPQTADAPTAATVASAVRTELTTELGRVDAAISTRLASAGYTAPLDAAGTRTAVGLATANLDTQLADLPTNAELTTALGTADDAVLTAIGDLPTNAELATALAAADDAVLSAVATVDTVVDAIKAQTDQLGFTDGSVDANITHVIADPVVPGSSKTTNWGGTA
jgi:hypothetical protein